MQQTIEMSKETYAFWKKLLRRKTAWPDIDDCSTIEEYTAKFRGGYQADIKLVNSDSGPYIDAVLFDRKGCEIAVAEPAFDLDGSFEFEVDERCYTVELKRV